MMQVYTLYCSFRALSITSSQHSTNKLHRLLSYIFLLRHTEYFSVSRFQFNYTSILRRTVCILLRDSLDHVNYVTPKQAYVALRGFLDNRHIKVVGLSALRTGRIYPQKYPGTHFERLSRPRAHGLVGCLGKNPQ
jgi:hypothetical protein